MKNYPILRYSSISLVGIFISLLLFYLINDKIIEKNKITVENAITKTEFKIKSELHKINRVIESMSFLFENSTTISDSLFQAYTDPFKEDLKGIKALEWAPKLLESDNLKQEVTSDSFIPTIKEANEANDLVMSKHKELYYPIALVNPPDRKWVSGYDLYSEANRKSAILTSSKSKKLTFTAPIVLVKDHNLPGFLAVKTVFEPNGIVEKGVVAVVYRMDQFLEKTLSTEIDVLDLVIYDQEVENSLLFNSHDNETVYKNTENNRTTSIKAANRVWEITYYPKEAYLGFPHIFSSYFVLIFGILTTALIVINLKRVEDHRKEKEVRVLQRNKELEISNKQKENLLREIHHRVKNNLQITSSLMNLQKRKLQDQKAIYALSSSQDRINAIALIHKKIYQHEGANAVDLKKYLENLVLSHKNILPSLNYTIDCKEVYIDLDTAVPLAIITSEIVVNAIKHAFVEDDATNQLYILVTQMKNDVLDIVISDNGQGISATRDLNENEGLGYAIIKKLCRQLEATYEYSSSESGTAFSLRFKQRKLKIPVLT